MTLIEPRRAIDGIDPGQKTSGTVEATRGAPVRVLILIPSLAVGGAEMDLVRNLPRVDRHRFKIVVCTYLERGALADKLIEAGIEVVGPFPYPRRWGQRLRGLLQADTSNGQRPQPLSLKPVASQPRSMLRLLGHRLLPAAIRATRADRLILRIAAGLARLVPNAHSYFQIANTVGSLVRSADIDVIHAMLPMSYIIGGIASSSVGVRPLVMSRLSLNYYHEQHAVIGMVERAVLHRTVDAAIGNSAAVLDDLDGEGISKARLRLVQNGIDSARFIGEMIDSRAARDRLGVSQSALVLTVVAGLWSYKGHADLLRALHHARERLPSDWVLLLVGRNVEGNQSKLERLADELGLARHIRFLGECDDVPAVLSASNIHVSASHTEGMPNNILEAMCAGLPVVATAVGGVPELVVDGRTALLVPKGDTESLGDAIGVLANDKGRRMAMGSAGRARVETDFSIERSVTALEDVYGEFVEQAADVSGPPISPA